MNFRIVFALALSLSALLSGPGAVFAVDIGQPAPAISATDAEGRPIDLSALRGKLVYVDFWASWCGPCRQSFPWMNAMHEKYESKGLAIVGVNVDARHPDAERFLAQHPAQFAIAYDAPGVTPKAYAIKGMPTSVLIDPQGRVLMVHSGFRDDDRDTLEAKIRQSLP